VGGHDRVGRWPARSICSAPTACATASVVAPPPSSVEGAAGAADAEAARHSCFTMVSVSAEEALLVLASGGGMPVQAFPFSMFRDKNRCDIGKSQSKWTAKGGNAWRTLLHFTTRIGLGGPRADRADSG
jgi:hypothetical protein